MTHDFGLSAHPILCIFVKLKKNAWKYMKYRLKESLTFKGGQAQNVNIAMLLFLASICPVSYTSLKLNQTVS